MTEISDFPVELLLEVFSHLVLTALVASQGVCRQWRQLVPLSDIPPVRRTLLEFYLEIISSAFFKRTRPWTIANLRPFNRDAYINTLLSEHHYLPEEFRLWLLEWPAQAVLACAWPGLPCVECIEEMADNVERFEGWNWLGCIPPQVSVLTWTYLDQSDPPSLQREILPGLLIWSLNCGSTWLMLDERDGKRDKVYVIGEEMEVISGEDGDVDDVVYPNWIEWQRSLWKLAEHRAKRSGETKGGPREVAQPQLGVMIPAKAWTWRDEPGYLPWS